MGTSFHHQNQLHNHNPFPIRKLISWALYLLIPLALIHLYLFPLSFSQPSTTPTTISTIASSTTTSNNDNNIIPAHSTQPPTSKDHSNGQPQQKKRRQQCNYSDGSWVPGGPAPLYNGTSCGTIKEGQNCMAHGRPDTNYLHWRWQPNHCNLPPFDPLAFLHFLRNKHLAFIGDSMARNQLESLLCLFSSVEAPELVYTEGEDNKFRRWVFRTYNATVSVLWSPFLVKGIEKNETTSVYYNKLFLDEVNERWGRELEGFDMVVFSFGHWYLHQALYYDNGALIGCHEMRDVNCTQVGFFGVFRMAVRTTLNEVIRRSLGEGESSSRIVVLTTFSPAHFEGEWDKFGACPKTEPFKEGEKEMEYMDAEMRKIEVEEVAEAKKTIEERGGVGRLRIEALDVTKLALMRPDGHPGPYMHPNPFAEGVKDRVQNDCVHWCMPGPIDTWNEILLDLVRS